MPALLTQNRTAQQQSYLPIQVESLRIDKVLNFDIYINTGRELVLYRSKSLPFRESSRAKLEENHVTNVYIPSEARGAYQSYIEENLPEILKDPKVPEVKKASILYETSQTLVKDVLANPVYSENIRRSQDMVENTVGFILKGRKAFLNLMTITSFDYYTYTHSVNVCTFSVALARQIGITDSYSLAELGTGALLHDVGKSMVSERILNKRARLNRSEFEIIKRHPGWGVDILRKTNVIADDSYYPVIGHHERSDGSGYPNGIQSKDQHIYSRIVAICDVFDALTTQRVYQDAINTFPALQIMHNMKGALDPTLLREFTVLMGPTTTENTY